MSSGSSRLRGVVLPACACSLIFSICSAPLAAQVVISQIFGGGNQPGTLYQEDYIELYNTSAGSVNLSTWSVHYQTATGTTWTKINLSGSIPGNGYFLLKTTSTPVGTGLDYGLLSIGTVGGFADQASSFQNLDPVAGKIALLNSTGTLSGGGCPPTPSVGTIQDYVGYGTTTNCSEPTGTPSLFANNAPAPDNRQAIFRRLCGSGDGNNNGTDFFTGIPNPRNANVPANLGISAWGGGSPSIVRAGDQVLLMVVPRNCAGGTALGVTVNVNLSPVGGSNPQSFLDDGTGGDEIAGDGIYSYLHSVPAGTGAGTKAMVATITSGGSSGGCLLVQTVSLNSGPTNDNCRSATAIPPSGTPGAPNSYGVSGVSIAGNLTGAMAEYNASMTNYLNASGFVSMNGAAAMRYGLWYSCIGTGTTMTAELCATAPAFDNVIQVLCGSCDGSSVVSAGDSECGASQARATWCSTSSQTYFVWVANFATDPMTNAFSLKITDNGSTCAGARPCTVCTPTCVGGATIEGETAPGHAVNDGCDASTINPSGAQSFTDVTVNAIALNICGKLRALGANSGVAGTVDNDWYRFQAGASDTFQASCTGQLPITIQLRQLSASGTCTTNTLVASASADRCATANISTPVTAGNWYALKVTPNLPSTVGAAGNNSGFMVGATSNNYIASMQNGAPPLNDVCGANVGAFTIVGSGGTVTGSSNNATNDGGLPGSPCPAGSKDVWHYFTPSGSGNWLIGTCGSSYDTIVNVYSGVCGSLTQIGCNDDTTQCSGGTSEVRVNLSSGTLYRIRIASKSGTTGPYSVSVFPSPINDDCASASSLNATCPTTTIGWGGTFEQSTAAATTDGSASCVASSRDYWYTFTPGVGGVWSIETCETGAALDTVVSMYSGCGAAELDCNDDAAIACTSALIHSRVTPSLTASTTYWIRVAMKGAVSSGGTISLSLIPPSPAGNDVCQAIPDPIFTIPGTGGIVSGNLRTASSEGNAASSCQNGEGQEDVLYYFTPSSSCPWNFSTCGCPNIDTTISIHTACPQAADNNQLASNCADDNCVSGDLSLLTNVNLAAGTPHVVRVSLWDSSSIGGPFTLTVTPGGSIQSTCATATPLILGASASSGDTSCAMNDGLSENCDPGGAASRVLWYSVNLVSALQPNQRLSVETCGSAIDTLVSVYSGSCASLVQIGCNDNCGGSPCAGTSSCLSLNGLTPGTYFIRVSDKGLSSGGTFNIKAAVVALNDLCASATPISCGQVLTGSTDGASYESPEPGPCNGPTGTGAQSLTYTEGVWYKITLPGTPGVDDKTITADTFLTSYNTKIWVFSGGCGTLNCVTMNDDVQGSPFTSRAAWRAIAGTEYLLLVGPFDIFPGTFMLRIACDPTPGNDLCSSATMIGGAAGSMPFTTIGATGANNTAATAMPSCNGLYSFFDVWYEISACSTGNLTLETCGGYDSILSVHTACPTLTVANQLEPVGASCNNDGAGGCAPGSSITVAVTQGNSYKVRVVGSIGTATGGSGTLSWSLPDSTLPVINNCPGNIVSNTNAANCAAVVSWTAPTASDNCPGVNITRTQGPPPGSTFANGTQTTIEYTATDTVNNMAVCSFTVTVAASPDIDNDGDVDLADVPLFVQVILGNDLDPLRRFRADTNCDGLVNGRDVRGMVDTLTP